MFSFRLYSDGHVRVAKVLLNINFYQTNVISAFMFYDGIGCHVLNAGLLLELFTCHIDFK